MAGQIPNSTPKKAPTKKRVKSRPLVRIPRPKLPVPDPGSKKPVITERKILGETRKLSRLNDGRCIIWHANIKAADERLNALLCAIENQKRPPDIVAIQDPPSSLPFKSCGNYIQSWCAADGEDVTSEDDPRVVPYKRPYRNKKYTQREWAEAKPLTKVAFLIHKSIVNYSVEEATGKNRDLVATMYLKTPERTIAIHNCYNHCRSADIKELLEGCCNKSMAHVLVGDFNVHDELWAGPKAKADTKGALLAFQSQSIGLKCLNEPGVITYSRSKDTSGRYLSVLDLGFISEDMIDHAKHRVLKKIPGFISDHRICEVVVDLGVERRQNLRYVWRLTPRKEYEKLVEELLATIELRPLENETDVEQFLGNLIFNVIKPAVAELVPVVRMYEPKPSSQSFDTSKHVRTQKFRQAMYVLSSGERGVFHVAKRAVSWSKPKRVPRTPDLIYESKIFSTDPEKVDCFVQSTWNKTRKKGPPLRSRAVAASASPPYSTSQSLSASQLPSAAPPSPASQPSSSTPRPQFPLPEFSSTRKQHFSSDHLEEGEIEELLKSLPGGKACGVDGVAYEAIKMCRRVIAPYLIHVFNACLRLRLHPDHFKDTITVVIKKLGKDANLPGSYRPIAILNTIGKLFERLIANRLKALAIKHNLLPATQFGAPRRSTTLALEHLLNPVYRGWICKKRASILALDLTGAYDHIDRKQLLENLMSRGIPDWLVELIWSFLSNRRSFIHMPGFEGDEY